MATGDEFVLRRSTCICFLSSYMYQSKNRRRVENKDLSYRIYVH